MRGGEYNGNQTILLMKNSLMEDCTVQKKSGRFWRAKVSYAETRKHRTLATYDHLKRRPHMYDPDQESEKENMKP